MDVNAEQLLKSHLFTGISGETAEACLIPAGRAREAARGSCLFCPGDRVSDLRILLGGQVRTVYYSESGQQDVRSMLFPPQAVGIDLVCTPTQISPYRAEAVADSVLFQFPADLLLLPGQLPEEERQRCMTNLLHVISNINMQNQYRLAILTRRSIRERVLVYLTMQAEKRQTATFTIPFSRDEMAAFLGVNRSALSHELSLLKEEGVIEFRKNRFTLCGRAG